MMNDVMIYLVCSDSLKCMFVCMRAPWMWWLCCIEKCWRKQAALLCDKHRADMDKLQAHCKYVTNNRYIYLFISVFLSSAYMMHNKHNEIHN